MIFTCDGVNVADNGLPRVRQGIPEYTPSIRTSRFVLPNGKLSGVIVAGAHGGSLLDQGGIGFVNIGREDGVVQRFRILVIFRDNLPENLGVKPSGQSPRETIGEFVILHVKGNSATGIVVNRLHEIVAGDGVELE